VPSTAEDDATAAVEQFAGPNFGTQVRECTPARAVAISASLAPPSMKMRFRNAGFVIWVDMQHRWRRISQMDSATVCVAGANGRPACSLVVLSD